MLPITLEEEASSTYGRIVDYLVCRLPIMLKGSLAILDQALISGSNFLIGILLARWLAPAQYGAYAMAFSIFLLFSLLHQSMLLEPQSVLGPSDYHENRQEYLGALLRLQIVLAAVVFLVLAFSSWVAHNLGWSTSLSGALAGVAIAAPCIMLFWLVRGACYVKLAPQEAIQGSFLYCLLLMGLLFLVYHKRLMSPFTAFLLMGFGALATSIIMLIRLKPSMNLQRGSIHLSAVIRKHWVYGRWALASSLVIWLPWNIYYSVLGRYSGMVEAGALRALMNLFLPLGQTVSALSLVILPYVARQHGQKGSVGPLDQTRNIMLLFASGGLAYWAIIIPIRHTVMRFLYNGNYTDVVYLIPWLALASIFWFCAHSTAIGLRAMQSPSSVFVVYGAASAVCLLIGLPVSLVFGLRGVILGINLSSFAALATGIFLTRSKLRASSSHGCGERVQVGACDGDVA